MTTVLQYCLESIWFGVQVFLLWLLADFITGVVHWWEDAYGDPRWKILGPYIVQPNLEHHRNPRAMVHGTYWSRISFSLYTAIILAILFYFCGWHSWRMVICLLFCSQGNEVHAIAHRTNEENGKFFVFLQKTWLMQGKRTHGWHHKAPYDTNFCVMTEFLNPILNKINFWTKIEWFLLKVFRIKVLRGSSVRGGI